MNTLSSRQRILATIRHNLKREQVDESLLNLRLQQKPRGVLPELSDAVIPLFIDKMQKSVANVEQIHSISDTIFILEKIIEDQKIIPQFRLAKNPLFNLISFKKHPDWIVQFGAAEPTDMISLTHAVCGVAETGTLVLLSSATSPTTLNFLPPIHIVLLNIKTIFPHYEDALDLIGQTYTAATLSRIINFISGPSRTSDIEQTAQFGAHGPKQLYVLLYQQEK